MNYYDENAQEFFDGTVDADMSSHHEKFLEFTTKHEEDLKKLFLSRDK